MAVIRRQQNATLDLYHKLYTEQKRLIRENLNSVSKLSISQQEEIITSMIKKYEKYSAADIYIVGFMYQNQLYRVTLNPSDIRRYVKLDIASRGGGYALKFSPTMDLKEELIKMVNAEVLDISQDDFVSEVEKGIEDAGGKKTRNRGHYFEKIVTELHGQKWYRDNIPFYVQGDLVDTETSIQYQIKFEGATLINQKTLANLILRRRFNLLKDPIRRKRGGVK